MAEADTGRLLGARVVAPNAGDIIGEATLAVRFGLTANDLISTLHLYLAWGEGLKLAAQTFTRDVTKLLVLCVSPASPATAYEDDLSVSPTTIPVPFQAPVYGLANGHRPAGDTVPANAPMPLLAGCTSPGLEAGSSRSRPSGDSATAAR